jgi:hypothetical protein
MAAIQFAVPVAQKRAKCSADGVKDFWLASSQGRSQRCVCSHHEYPADAIQPCASRSEPTAALVVDEVDEVDGAQAASRQAVVAANSHE